MMPEDRAARVAHRIVSPQNSWEQFERVLLSQQRPDWNQAVGLIADAIREAVQEVKFRPFFSGSLYNGKEQSHSVHWIAPFHSSPHTPQPNRVTSPPSSAPP